jgi:two-component system NtrC family response regulator
LLLAKYFLQRFAQQIGKPALTFDQEALRLVSRHPWPGNIRQLENCIHQAVVLAEGRRITAADLELPAFAPVTRASTLKEARDNVERELIRSTLRKHGGRVAPTAAELGVGRATLYDLMGKLGIDRE